MRRELSERFPLQGRKKKDSSLIFPKEKIDRPVAEPTNSVKEHYALFSHKSGELSLGRTDQIQVKFSIFTQSIVRSATLDETSGLERVRVGG